MADDDRRQGWRDGRRASDIPQAGSTATRRRKVNSGIVRLVRTALDANGERVVVELPRSDLVQVNVEFGRLKELLEEERQREELDARQMAAIERLETKIQKLAVPRTDVPKRKAYPLREAATLMGISLTKLKDLILEGAIAIVTAGKRRRILDAEINRYLLSGPASAHAPARRASSRTS